MSTATINMLAVTNIEALTTASASLTTTAIDILTGADSTIKRIDNLEIGALSSVGGSVTVTATLSGVACPVVTALAVSGNGAVYVFDEGAKVYLGSSADKVTLAAGTNATLSAMVNYTKLT